MRVIVVGAKGRMGSEVRRLLALTEHRMVAAVDQSYERTEEDRYAELSLVGEKADAIVDFSHHDGTREMLRFAVENHIPLVIATTGQTVEEIELIHRAAERIPIFFAANLSLGAAFLCETVHRAAMLFPEADVEIVEVHHREKADAPSGTALVLGSAISQGRKCTVSCDKSGICSRHKGEIGIHSLRIGSVAGEHTVMLSTGQETLTFTHRAEGCMLFARGAIEAMEFLIGKKAGLYDMSDLLWEREGTC